MKLTHALGAMAVVTLMAAAMLALPDEKPDWTFPVIKGFGAAWPLPKAAVQPEKNKIYKAVFDISRFPDKPDDVAVGLVHAARTYNVFASGGVPAQDMKVAIVMHGPAAIVGMNNQTYQAKYKIDNPNLPLLAELKKAGAEVYVCGQSVHIAKFDEAALAPEAQLATSAMIVLVSYQNKGYALMAF